ncbi:hypothetical protein HanPI659440_Chr14g0546591 [Helianthus annuus]|nr:hypothetical protein HanPI659440_Chr14g0546591 [Helianthus annuus]
MMTILRFKGAGRFYDGYLARINERLKRRIGESEIENKTPGKHYYRVTIW